LEDSALGLVLLPGNALGVYPQQHVYGVACPFGNLGRGDSGVKPCGYGGVPEVVGAAGQERRCFRSAERCAACLVEDREIGAVSEGGSTSPDENAALWPSAVLLEVAAEQRRVRGGRARSGSPLVPGA
jgi:hypothetical protein